jgi:hypothetical protein
VRSAALNLCALGQAAAVDLPEARSEQAALEAVLDALAPAFEGDSPVAGERRGALGTDTSVQFWRDALAVGPGFASPAAFPSCLANAPCGTLARRLSRDQV